VVDVQPHPQRPAQRSPGQADLDAAGPQVVLDRPAHEALAEVQWAVVFGALPALKRGHACLEGDVNDPPERQPARSGAHGRVHAGPAARLAGAAARGRRRVRGPGEHAAPAADARDAARDDALPLGGQVQVLARAGGWCHVMLLFLDVSTLCCLATGGAAEPVPEGLGCRDLSCHPSGRRGMAWCRHRGIPSQLPPRC